jgi:selenide,water dikinase
MQSAKRIVAIGGGHCNCQVLKLLRKLVKDKPEVSITLVTDGPVSYYSGMLPGSVSQLYTEDDIKVHLEPLATWSAASFIDQKVVAINGSQNNIKLANGEILEYDVLAVNVGSRTKAMSSIPGVWEYSLTTRPINDLLPKIRNKENELKEKGIIPEVVVCGAGAAGTELAFAFKARWSKFFGQEIKVTLLGDKDTPLPTEVKSTIGQVQRLLEDKRIKFEGNCRVKEVKSDRVLIEDGREFRCDVAVWATGADP